MRNYLILTLVIAVLLCACEEEEITDSSKIEIIISNPNSISLAITTSEDEFIDTIQADGAVAFTIKAQPYTYFKAYNATSGCFKEFVYVNGLNRKTLESPLFSQCDDGDLYIISVLDTLEYFLISKVLKELYPDPPQINIYQRTADSDDLIKFEKYNSDLDEIERDTLNGIPIDSATTANYWNKNYEYDRWFNFRDQRVKVIPRSELRCLLQYYDLNNGGFNPGDYDCKYGEIPLFQFSRVGLNEGRNQALVSFFDDQVTRRVLLSNTQGEWSIVAQK